MYMKSKETIQTMLDVARTLFIEKNYADVTINDIVSGSKVSKGALYHHFSNKEDLYLKMMHHFLAQIEESTREAAENSAGLCRERLYASMLNFLQLPTEMLGVLRLVRRDINIFKDPMRAELIRAYQTAVPEQVEVIIRAGIEDGELRPLDARLLSWELVALVEVVLRPYSWAVIGEPQEMTEFVIGLFFDGIGTQERVTESVNS
jgi:AcrR family transcriptional regulator